MFAFIAGFVILDFITKTKSHYNLISLSGVFVYICLLFCFSIAPRKVKDPDQHHLDLFQR